MSGHMCCGVEDARQNLRGTAGFKRVLGNDVCVPWIREQGLRVMLHVVTV